MSKIDLQIKSKSVSSDLNQNHSTFIKLRLNTTHLICYKNKKS